MSLSPPLSYLLKRVLPKFLGPPALILAIRHGLIAHGSSQYLPSIAKCTGGIALLSLASSVLFIAGRVWWHQLRTNVEARRLGATIVPKVKGKLPGNIDILWAMATCWADDYVGQPATELSKKYGTTFNLYILWEDWVSYSFKHFNMHRSNEPTRSGRLILLILRLCSPRTFPIISKVCIHKLLIKYNLMFLVTRSTTSGACS